MGQNHRTVITQWSVLRLFPSKRYKASGKKPAQEFHFFIIITFLGRKTNQWSNRDPSLKNQSKRFQNEAILDVKTHYKPTETFQYTHYSSCHPPGVKKGFIKGEAIRLLRTNSSERNFQEAMCNFKTRLEARGYPKSLIEKTLSEVSFAARQSTLKKTNQKN